MATHISSFVCFVVFKNLRSHHPALPPRPHSSPRYNLGAFCGILVKGCTLVENGYGMFPDAPTERGEKHIRELIKAKREGYDAAILFVVMRPDANLVIPNMRTDIKFAKAVRDARSVGVKFFAYSFFFDGRELHPFREIKVLI